MTNNGIVQIHGKDYMTVARRVELAQQSKALQGVETEVLNHDPVVVKAKVIVNEKLYTGISAVDLNSNRVIEKQNPYEVAETSAVGRALGFAGYGLLESIASADEMTRAADLQAGEKSQATDVKEQTATCEVCGASAIEKNGKTRAGKEYHGIFCSTENRSHTRWLWN